MEKLQSRAVIRLSGVDAAGFLQGLISQDVSALMDGRAAFACLLSPQGKIFFEFLMFKRDDAILLDVRRDGAPALLRKLNLHRLRAAVQIDLAPTMMVVVNAGNDDPRTPQLPKRDIVDQSDINAGDDHYDAARLTAGVPELGRDFESDEKFLLDVNYDALNGINYAKGCFIGQEVTSRMKRKGEVRKRTLIATFGGDAPPPGASIVAGESEVGAILSGSKGRALAQIRLDRLAAARTAGNSINVDGREVALSWPEYLGGVETPAASE